MRQQMLPFLERSTRRQRVFKRVILGATLVVLASMIGVSQSARYRLLLGTVQTRDVLVRRLFGLEPERTEVEAQWRLRRQHGIAETLKSLTKFRLISPRLKPGAFTAEFGNVPGCPDPYQAPCVAVHFASSGVIPISS
ncbi:MAG: hypothetical protein WBQ11_10675 [Isosphaeraceae bacterium]